MQIINALGERRGASQVKTAMVKTILVNVDLDVRGLRGSEVSEEEIEEMAHEDWLEAWGDILKVIGEWHPYIDVELFSTDNVEIEVIE